MKSISIPSKKAFLPPPLRKFLGLLSGLAVVIVYTAPGWLFGYWVLNFFSVTTREVILVCAVFHIGSRYGKFKERVRANVQATGRVDGGRA